MGVGCEKNFVMERACEDLNGQVPGLTGQMTSAAPRAATTCTHHRRTGSKPGNCLGDRPPQPYNKRVG